jgi:nicotinate-nucleotide adenylyltransferase
MDLEPIGRPRVAFFGGSFDPPHLGHLEVARAAQSALGLDTVLFAPVGEQPLKPQGSTASFAHRIAMTRLAISGEPAFAVSLADAPKPSGAPNFTIDTLLTLRAQLPPDGILFCLMGADAFALLRRWHRAAEIPFVAPLIVASRPSESLSQLDDLMPFLPDGLTMVSQGFSTNSRCAVKLDSESILCQGATALCQGVASVAQQIPQNDCEALQAAEKLKAEGGGGFNPRINPAESARALAPEVRSSSDSQIDLRRYILRNPSGQQAPFYLLPGLDIEISASQIRDQLRTHAPAAANPQTPHPADLPAAVSEYIRAHRLYR